MSIGRKEIYLEVIKAAFVMQNTKDKTRAGKMLVKFQGTTGEELIGFLFTSVAAVDSCLAALERVKSELEKAERTDPRFSQIPKGHKGH